MGIELHRGKCGQLVLVFVVDDIVQHVITFYKFQDYRNFLVLLGTLGERFEETPAAESLPQAILDAFEESPKGGD